MLAARQPVGNCDHGVCSGALTRPDRFETTLMAGSWALPEGLFRAAWTSVDEDCKALGRALRVLRRKTGVTHEQAGRAAGVAGEHISAAELGERGGTGN